MKKVILLLFVVLISKVNALEYIELTNECEESDYIKCEPVKYNRFYFEEITDYTYEEESFNSELYPYIDKNDTKLEATYTINNTGNIEYNLYRINFGYEIDSISFENIDINDSDLIKVYYNNTLYNDYIINKNGKYLEYNFYEILNPEYLVIKVDNKIIKNYMLRLKLNNNYIHQASISASNNIESTNVLFKDDTEYRNLLSDLNVTYNDYKLRVKYYENNKILYKFYNVVKTYYKDLDVDYLEGYKYDEEESYYLYKKYNVNNNIESVNTVSFTKPLSIYYGKPTHNSINQIDSINPIKYRNKSKIKRFNLSKPSVYFKLKKNFIPQVKKNYSLFLIVFILIASLRIMYVKFNYKNAT